MSNTEYERRLARRSAERERNLCGETLAEYRARISPQPTRPGAGIPHTRAVANFDLFGPMFENAAARQFNMGFPLGRRRA